VADSKANSVGPARRFQLVPEHRANWFEIVDIERCWTKGNRKVQRSFVQRDIDGV